MLLRFLAVLFLSIMVAPIAMAIEEPEFKVLLKTEEYEIRQYDPYIVAEVDIDGEFKDSGGSAFRILAGYIFGDNISREKMEMTAPVESRESERMAMTAPVTTTESMTAQGSYVYSFVMERKYTLDTLPEPTDPRIRIRQHEPRVMAVRRYSGTWSERAYRENEQALLQSLADAEIEVSGPAILARYDSPFKPWFMRRNEIMVEIDWDDGARQKT